MKSARKQTTYKLTPSMLRSIIEEEVKSFGAMEDVVDRAKDTEETDADEYADAIGEPIDWKKANHIKESDTLDEHVSYMKALKLEESRLTRRLAQVRVNLQKGAKKLVAARIV